MRRAAIAAWVAAAFAVAAPAAAWADGRYESVVDSVRPPVPGVEVTVIGSDSQLRLANRSGRTVTVYGYRGDAVGRVLGSGAVQVNLGSPSYWINLDRMGSSSGPTTRPTANRWRTENRTGVLIWHDHRMHWMGTGLAPGVKERSKRTLIWNWRVPIEVDHKRGAINGKLWWRGQNDGAPLAAFIGLGVAAGMLVIGAAAALRRRRG